MYSKNKLKKLEEQIKKKYTGFLDGKWTQMHTEMWYLHNYYFAVLSYSV